MTLIAWKPCATPQPDFLLGEHANLERLNWAEHGDGLFAAVCGAENNDLWQYMPIGPFVDQAEFEQIFEFARDKFGWETMVIRGADTGVILGMSSYMRIRAEHGSAEVGCVAFGADLKRTRAATEAMYLMASHLFDTLGYRRYEWKCHNENAASKNAAERFGFRFEGIFRNDMVVKGENRDTAWYAMTDQDWPAVKEAFCKWLVPVNFKADGQQIKSLRAIRQDTGS